MPAPEHTEITFPDSSCFGCSQTNPHGLGLRFRRVGDHIQATVTLAERFQGAPGIAHGGIVGTLLDEVACAAVFFVYDRMVVTGELTVRYEHAVPVEVPLELDAHVSSRDHDRYALVLGEVRRDGDVLARSTGKFFYQERLEPAP